MSGVFDLHCDTPHNIAKQKFNHVTPSKLYQQNYLGAIFAHFVYPQAKHPFVDVVKMLATTIRHVEKEGCLQIARHYRAVKRDSVNIILGAEGGHIFDKVFAQFEALYGLGVRVFTLTWNNSNRLAHSALDVDKKGLTKLGKSYIKKLNNYEVILDMSHASTRTVLDVCDICEHGVIASHSCVRTLNPTFLRNIDDRAIKAINERGGVVGINFSKHHLGGYGVVDHINYLCDKFGVDCAAIGSDFDGITDPVIVNPRGLASLEKQLLKKGYKRTEVDKIFSENFLRVLKKSVVRKT
jgi:membrane dipeptidase